MWVCLNFTCHAEKSCTGQLFLSLRLYLHFYWHSSSKVVAQWPPAGVEFNCSAPRLKSLSTNALFIFDFFFIYITKEHSLKTHSGSWSLNLIEGWLLLLPNWQTLPEAIFLSALEQRSKEAPLSITFSAYDYYTVHSYEMHSWLPSHSSSYLYHKVTPQWITIYMYTIYTASWVSAVLFSSRRGNNLFGFIKGEWTVALWSSYTQNICTEQVKICFKKSIVDSWSGGVHIWNVCRPTLAGCGVYIHHLRSVLANKIKRVNRTILDLLKCASSLR